MFIDQFQPYPSDIPRHPAASIHHLTSHRSGENNSGPTATCTAAGPQLIGTVYFVLFLAVALTVASRVIAFAAVAAVAAVALAAVATVAAVALAAAAHAANAATLAAVVLAAAHAAALSSAAVVARGAAGGRAFPVIAFTTLGDAS